MEGSHTGLMIGPVYTKAVVFLKAFPDERSLTVDTMLVVYTQLDERHWVLRSLLTIVRPLVEDTVTRIVGKAFTVADKLGAYIAEDPERVMQVASSLSSVDPEEVQRLLVLLRERSGTKSYTSFSPKSGNED
jgi:hypothetical protein